MIDDKTATATLQELIDATKAQTRAEDRSADQQAEANRIELMRRQQEDARQKAETERAEQFERMLSLIQHCESDHQRPMLVILLDIKQKTEILLKLNEVIATRVIGTKETQQLIEAMSKMVKSGGLVKMDVGTHDIEFGDIAGDVNARDIAGRDVK
jgi:hypothetical protein